MHKPYDKTYTAEIIFLISEKNKNFLLCTGRPLTTSKLVGRLYLTWSFLHLLGRLVLVSLTGASLHTQALRPLNLLLALPSNR